MGSYRRDFLKSVIPAAIAVSSPIVAMSATPSEDQCEYHARKLAEAMQAKHGGKWRHIYRADLKSVYVLNSGPV